MFELVNLKAELAAAVANQEHCYRRASGTDSDAIRHHAQIEAELWSFAIEDLNERIKEYERNTSNGT